MLDRAWLDADTTGGLIALSGAREGDIGRASGRRPRCARRVSCSTSWLALFGDRLLPRAAAHAAARAKRRASPARSSSPAASACRWSRPTTCASSPRRLRSARGARLHPRRRALDDPERPRRYSDEQYLKSPEEMAELFSDMPEALENSRRDRAPLQPRAASSASRAAGVSGCRRHGRSSSTCARRPRSRSRGTAEPAFATRRAAPPATRRLRIERASRPSSTSSARWASPATS